MAPIGGVRSGIMSAARDAIPDSGVSRYRFEQDVTDSWGSFNATDNTSVGYITGQVGDYAKDFAGDDDWINFGNITPIEDASNISVSAWIYQDSEREDDFEIIGRWEDNNFDNGIMVSYSNSANELSAIVANNGTRVDARGPQSLDSWLNFVFTFDSGELTAYIDGSEVGSDTGGPSSTPSLSLTAGRREFDNVYYDGALDDIRFYDKTLTSTEVSNLYNTGSING